ncbi:MAG TPA: dethiobiotin synthase [Candidatus Binatia bacterium]
MGKGVLVTGTDTGVGKTLVACGLASALRGLGYRVGVMKPAETGCAEREGDLFPSDAYQLQQASGSPEPLHRICPYRFSPPVAPAVAAESSGGFIDLSLLARLYGEISHANDLTIVEGAGGLLVPLQARFTYADLARQLGLPLIVVVANRLGALNHTLLTLEHASCLDLRILGYLLNNLEEETSPAAQINARSLRGLTRVPCLGEIPYLGPPRDAGNGPVLGTSPMDPLFHENIGLQSLVGWIREG